MDKCRPIYTRTSCEKVLAIGDVTDVRPEGAAISVPKAGMFAEGQGKAVAWQIINEIESEGGEGDRKTERKKRLLDFLQQGSTVEAIASLKLEAKRLDILKLIFTSRPVQSRNTVPFSDK